MRALVLSVLVILCVAVAPLPSARAADALIAEPVIDASNADALLRRGDVLVKFLGDTTKATTTELLIQGGQKLTQKLAGEFDKRLKEGDAKSFHLAMYIGKGRTAEAHGGDIATARVAIRSLDAHAGYYFQVFRPNDAAIGEAAARVAETWAGPARMHYAVPALVPLENASFGEHAKKAALDYGHAAGEAGGPHDVSKMFCSEFVVAAYQGAIVSTELARNAKLSWKHVSMLPGVDLHAAHASPLAVHSRLVDAASKRIWTRVGEVLVRPGEDPGGSAPSVAPGPDVTASLTVIGNPSESRWSKGDWIYARNPWSLRAFDGKIYIGGGNSNNASPAPNAGPVDLFVYDPDQKKLASEYVVGDEQVDVLRVTGGQLWIPGHDSRVVGPNASKEAKDDPINIAKDWAFGNVYRKTARGWEKHRTIKNGIHVYDVLVSGGKLFAAVSTLAGGVVARSTDDGASWHEMLTYAKPGERTRSLFELGGRLYASTTGGRVYRYDGDKAMTEANVHFFPGVTDPSLVFVARPTSFRDQVVYVAGKKLIDHDWTPAGLFAAVSADAARRVMLPAGALPRDLLVRGDTLYVLASTQPTPMTTEVHVFATKDLKTWSEALRFTGDTFARSFEELGGDFYFGLGCEPDRLMPSTGRIVRAPRAAIRY